MTPDATKMTPDGKTTPDGKEIIMLLTEDGMIYAVHRIRDAEMVKHGLEIAALFQETHEYDQWLSAWVGGIRDEIDDGSGGDD